MGITGQYYSHVFVVSNIAILNDYTRYQAEPGNAYPEALPP